MSAAAGDGVKKTQLPDCLVFICTSIHHLFVWRTAASLADALSDQSRDAAGAGQRERQDVTACVMEVEWEEDADHLPQVPVC